MAKAGPPLKFKDLDELTAKVHGYFEHTPEDEWTWTGLCLELGCERETLVDYREGKGDRGEYAPLLKWAFMRIENGYEKDLKKRGHAGSIFALKNFGWKDKSESELYGKNGRDLIPTPILDVPKDNGDSEDNSPEEAD